MFLRKYFVVRTNLWKKYLITNCTANYLDIRYSTNVGLACSFHSKYRLTIYNNKDEKKLLNIKTNFLLPLNRKWNSNGLIDGDSSQLLSTQRVKDLTKISELFPQPRVTLNELQSKTLQKIFDVHYKQNVVAPKGKLKRIVQSNDWLCTYAFVWPEKMKFESTAISKRQAAEKAAAQALLWLYINKRINNTGSPIYDKSVLSKLNGSINEPIQVTISGKSMERLDRIWNDYESGIKDIYEATFKEAKRRSAQTPAAVTKDSTIDEDDFSENEADVDVEIADLSELKVPIHPVYGKSIKPPTDATLERRDRVLRNKFQKYDESLTALPIDQYTEEITSTVSRYRVVVIVGAAGCGKSTRAPAALLRRCGARVAAVVSEPRRVAAIGLAERVAAEMGEQVGDSIGYQVRLHAKPPLPPCGSILYCTSGVLLRRLQMNPGLEGCTHVFIDEAHERDVNTDITLLLLKRALNINPDLKIVVMSATLDIGVFTKYFDSCPVIEVPGRTFPVEVSYLDEIQKKFNVNLPNTMENCRKADGRPQINCQEVAEVIKAVDKTEKEGAILVFLPGWAEIKLTKQLLEEHYGVSSLHMILPVHSRLSTTDQTKMFAIPPLGVRKIVLSTNVAETSITIPDVVYVIDSGAHKENRLKENAGTASLETVWVSQAGGKQRTGRAGRVQPGHCYRLYTKEKEGEFAPHTTPEILRIPLEQTVLDCKTYAPEDKVEDFLSQLPEPPSRKAIQFAVNDLVDLGALTPSEQLTRLGVLVSRMSVHPRLGRSVLHAAVVGNVVATANVVTHCSDNIELFKNAADRREEIRSIKGKYSATSDHASLHWIQDEFEQMLGQGRTGVEEWCDRYGLRSDRLGYVTSLSNLHLEQLLKSGVMEPSMDPQELNRFSDIDVLTSAVLLSGVNAILNTKRYVRTKGKLMTVTELFTSTGDRAHIGSESVNYAITKRNNKTNLLAYFGGHHSAERRALVVYKTSLISPHAALLFCMGDVLREIDTDSDGENTILYLRRHKLKVYLPTSQADHILKAREMLWNTFQYYIERDLKNLDYDENTNVLKFKVRLVKAIGRVLVEGEGDYVDGKNNLEDVEDLG